MADYDSSLPIRSEADGADERVQVKIVDKDNPGTQQATVDADSNVKVGVYGDRADTQADVALQLSEEGRPNSRGDYEVDDNSKPASSAPILHQRKNTAETPTEVDQLVRPTGVAYDNGSDETVVVMDVGIRDEDGVPFSQNNPLPVSLEESEGDEILDYNTSASVASDASVNHDYTVTAATTFIGDQIWASGSGKLKIVVQVEDAPAAGTYTTKFVAFNSTANTNIEIPLLKRLKVAAGVIIRLTLTNRDNQPQDLYSTLLGIEK